MTMPAAMHLLGCASLIVIAGVAGLIFRDAWTQRARIAAALRRQSVPPAASVAFPHRPRRPQLRVVEADVELTQGIDA